MSKTNITEPRLSYKKDGKFDYPEYFLKYQKGLASVWRPQEVPFQSDVRDWQSSSDEDREVIGGILTGFTTLEGVIGDFWSLIADKFKKAEIIAMARMFSLQEVVHAEAYNTLSDELGLDEYESFLSNETAQKKVGDFESKKEVTKVNLGIFSGAGEGVSLFSSFAILLNFARRSKFKGLSQIISWSAIDEQTHSNGGCSLFRQWVREDGLTQEEIRAIKEGFDRVLENEERFLENIFGSYTINGLDVPSLMAYMKSRANNRLRELGIYSQSVGYEYEATLSSKVKDWFEPMVFGTSNSDFFAYQKDGGNYVSKPTQNFKNVDVTKLNLQLL